MNTLNKRTQRRWPASRLRKTATKTPAQSKKKRKVESALPFRHHSGVDDLRVHSKSGRVKAKLEKRVGVHVPVLLPANLQLEQVGEDVLREGGG